MYGPITLADHCALSDNEDHPDDYDIYGECPTTPVVRSPSNAAAKCDRRRVYFECGFKKMSAILARECWRRLFDVVEEANAIRTTHARLNEVIDLVRTARRKRQKRDIFDNATDRIAELVGDRECTLEGCYGPGKGASWISKWTRVVMFNDGFMNLQGLADRYALRLDVRAHEA